MVPTHVLGKYGRLLVFSRAQSRNRHDVECRSPLSRTVLWYQTCLWMGESQQTMASVMGIFTDPLVLEKVMQFVAKNYTPPENTPATYFLVCKWALQESSIGPCAIKIKQPKTAIMN